MKLFFVAIVLPVLMLAEASPSHPRHRKHTPAPHFEQFRYTRATPSPDEWIKRHNRRPFKHSLETKAEMEASDERLAGSIHRRPVLQDRAAVLFGFAEADDMDEEEQKKDHKED